MLDFVLMYIFHKLSIYILFESLFSNANVHMAFPQSFSSHIVLAINELVLTKKTITLKAE
jgi:hypothetical protein